jgi:uncharacterized protein YjbI with pentapeptide repeats
MKNYYEILGLPQDASFEDIKSKYHYLVFVYHPDRFSDPTFKKKAEEDLKEINIAFEVLSNPESRLKYDNSRGIKSSSSSKEDKTRTTSQVVKNKPIETITREILDDRIEEVLHKSLLMKRAGRIIFHADVDCSGLDLSGLDLSNIFKEEKWTAIKVAAIFNFANSDLHNTILDGNYLSTPIFFHANLHNTKIRNAMIHDGNYDQVSLIGADFSDTKLYISNLRGLDFSNCKMINAYIGGANSDLSDSKFCGTNISGGYISQANLDKVDFSDATLIDIRFKETYGARINLRGSTLTKANLSWCKFYNSDFSDTDLRYTDLYLCDLSGSNLSNCDLSGAKLHYAKLNDCNLKGANLSGATGSDKAYINNNTIFPDGSTKSLFNKLSKFAKP